jgi:hypothetical protein
MFRLVEKKYNFVGRIFLGREFSSYTCTTNIALMKLNQTRPTVVCMNFGLTETGYLFQYLLRYISLIYERSAAIRVSA